ncbi:MAG: NAD(P)H-dependent oxidoreductase [Alphaproteobacteria bacterium]|nr:NAD(P)H-dependent oxidoreductase [Alphaproteobacteria bacterium]
MNRRDFIKGTLAAGALAMLPKALKAGGEKQMKILVLTGSPRKNGNSATLADNFIKGAEEAGHHIERFDAAFKKVHPCIACNHCGMDGPCVFSDDFNFVREHIVDADAVAFVTPMYYFGISAQLKTVIDRFYAINGRIHRPKKAVLLMTYADTAAKEAQPIISHYETLLNYLGWTDAGRVIASGVWPVGAVNKTKYPQQAYELGKNIGAV